MDTIELSLCELDLRFYFVTIDGKQHDELTDLNCCFEVSVLIRRRRRDSTQAYLSTRFTHPQHIADRFESTDSISWISEPDCIRMASADAQPQLTRKSVFLFAEFAGAAFDQLRTTKALILGPLCVIHCFLNDTNIPNIPSPIFNVTLRDQHVCSSSLPVATREHVQRLVQYMGGQFNAHELSANTNYLITATTMSVKYEKAVAYGIRTVTPAWVDDLWQRSRSDTNFVLSPENADRLYEEHRIPLFHKLGITSTGIGAEQRTQLKALIEANGGLYHGTFKSELIDILAVQRSQTGSDKFRAAVKCRKTCLTPEWFTDSVQKGFALPIEEYRVLPAAAPNAVLSKGLSVSTPTKRAPTNESAFNANCTNLSEIMGNVTVDESRMCVSAGNTSSSSRASGSAAHAGKADNAYKVVLANINVQQAKKSGAFLDGCNVSVWIRWIAPAWL